MRFHIANAFIGLAAFAAFAGNAEADVRVAVIPAESVFAEPAGAGVDLMLQNIVVSHSDAGEAVLVQVRIDLLRQGRLFASHWIDPETFVRASAELNAMSRQGAAPLIGAQLLDPCGLGALVGEETML